MSTREWLCGALAGAFGLTAAAMDAPLLGSPPSAELLAALSITVMADGSGLPAGQGTAHQGEAIYREKCLACHGEAGVGGSNDRLAGGVGSLATERPVQTIGSYWPYATTVFDYVRRAMPYQQPGSLSDNEVYAITAYLLHINGIIGIDEVVDADSLPAIDMPNAGGFHWALD